MNPSSLLMGLILLTAPTHQLPLIQHLYPKKKKSAWWTLSLSASRRTLSWWPIAKEKASLPESRSCQGLLWVTGDQANCSRGCTARQEAACVWFGGSMVCYCSLLLCSLKLDHQNIFTSHVTVISLAEDICLFYVDVHPDLCRETVFTMI